MARKEKKVKKPKSKAGKIVKTVFSSIAILLLLAVFLAANVILPTYGRMVNEILTYKQGWSTPKTELDLQY